MIVGSGTSVLQAVPQSSSNAGSASAHHDLNVQLQVPNEPKGMLFIASI